MKLSAHVRLYELELRPVAVAGDTAAVFSGGEWVVTSTHHLARKAAWEGAEMNWDEFASEFPEAVPTFPTSLFLALGGRED